jgi:hypothetical protein
MSTITSPIREVLSRLERVENTGSGQWQALCPAHEDRNPSLSIGEGDDKVLLNCHAGCEYREIVSALGLEPKDLFESDDSWGPFDDDVQEAAVYPYHDREDELAFEVVRFEPEPGHPARGEKTFRQRDQDGNWGVERERVLYRLPDVLEAARKGKVVFVVEGEKDVHTLEELGFTATTNPMGAGTWREAWTESLEGANVVIIPDNDDEGWEHAHEVAEHLLSAAESVRVVDLPDVPTKGDVTDWVKDGGTADELKQLVSETTLFELAPNGHSPKVEVFWYVDESKGKVKIDRSRMIRFLEDHGFGKTYSESELESMLVRVQNNVVRRTSTERIKDFVLRYVRGIDDEDGLPLGGSGNSLRQHGQFSANDVADALLRGANVYFSTALFEFLSPLDLNFHRDTAESSFFYFQNGFVEVTADGFELHPYSEMGGVIWKDQIIDRDFIDFTDREPAGWDWHEHLRNVAGREVQRHNALCTALGYLQHGYKDPAVTKAVIFMDEKDSDVEEGRTGKSLTAKALQHTCSTLRLDGRNFSFDSRFAFQEVRLDTQVVDFNDVRERFPFERLFSLITDDFPVERKGQERVTIPFQDSPKFLMSTNYVIEGKGASFEDRTFQLEFADYYSTEHSPEDEFGHRLFDDWEEEEWAQFDNVMMACVRQYLRDGLADYEHVNVDFRQLKQGTCPDFAEWAVSFIKPGKEYEKDALWRTFREAYSPDYEDLTKRKFGYWLSDFARVYDLDKNQSKRRSDDGRKRYVTFETKE